MERTRQRYVPITLFVVTIVLVAARIGSHLLEPSAAEVSPVRWTIPEALQQRTIDKPVLFLFTADWSAPSRAVEAEIFANPQLARTINERFIPVRVVDRAREEGRNDPRIEALQRRFNVKDFPTVIFSDSAGNELARMEGSRTKEEFEQVMMSVR